MPDESNEVQPHEHDGLSRRRALGYGGAIVAGAAASQLIAENASAAGGRGSQEMRTISLAQANRIVAAGVQYVKRHDLPPMFILVVDACGDEKASRRMDGNSPAAVALVPPKAATARAFRTPTAQLAQSNADNAARIASFVAAGFSLLGGGRPIFEGDMLIGAIGVGGGSPDQDDEVAAAALKAL
jgi:uncharacterized protein GlcG (DUF336 family)